MPPPQQSRTTLPCMQEIQDHSLLPNYQDNQEGKDERLKGRVV